MIEWRGVSKHYSSRSTRVQVLDSIDFQLNAGDFYALVGRSGSGKTTVLNLMGGLDQPSEGEVLFEGNHIEKMSDEELSFFRNQSVGFVFQSFYLRAMRSAIDNVMVPLLFAGNSVKEARTRAREVLEQVGLGALATSQIRRLSGGQRQRVAIARAVANRPRLLLADEPTGNLDTATSLEIFELLMTYNKEHNTAIMVVTHDPLVEQFHIPMLTIQDAGLMTHTGRI